jgi:hypothetical protein
MAFDRTIDSLSKNEFAQTLHCGQSVLEERYPPLAETLRAAEIEGASARKAFAAWCEDDREQPLSQQELDEVEAWMRVWNSVSGEGDAAQALLKTVDDWMQRRSPKWLFGWRGITNATNERSVIGSVVPLSGMGNSCHLLQFSNDIKTALIALFVVNVSSLVFDFVARQKIGGTNFNFFIPKQLPVIAPDQYADHDLAYIVPRVLELTYTAYDLSAWAQDLGHSGPPFPFNTDRRAQLRAELDAYYARLYGLTRDELRYILDPSDVMGDDYPSETFRVLKNGEMREFGEYRTQRLVLAAWDQLNGVV